MSVLLLAPVSCADERNRETDSLELLLELSNSERNLLLNEAVDADFPGISDVRLGGCSGDGAVAANVELLLRGQESLYDMACW